MSDMTSEPRPSSTILLLRDRSEMEVLMVKRHHEIDFASGALVFPGGKTCPDDARPGWADRCDGDFDEVERALRVAAMRELYEEAGIVLARPAGERGEGRPLVGAGIAAQLDAHRLAVDRGETSFLDLLADHELVLAGDVLVHFGHWITPAFMPKRFDTHFYVAALPAGQTAEQDGRETTEAVWLGPRRALEMETAGTATIIFPTKMNLGRLSLATSVEDALTRFSQEPVVTVLPKVVHDKAGSAWLSIPHVEGYGQTREPLGKLSGAMKGSARPREFDS